MKELTFEKRLKIHCKMNKIKYKIIASYLGINSQELYNILNGFQKSVPSKSIQNVEHAKDLIRQKLSLNF